MTRLKRRIGRGLLLLAFLLFAAIVIHPFAIRGKVWGGKVEDGRYFVVSAGHRYNEVSAAEWRIEQYLECSVPWLPLVLLWMGLAFRDGPDVLPKLTSFLGIVGVGGTGIGAVVGWVMTGDPLTPVLLGWLVLWGGCFLVAWLQSRSQSNVDPSAEPDPAGM